MNITRGAATAATRKSDPRAKRNAFAAALRIHLSNGARPRAPQGPRWTYAAFASALAEIVDDNQACSERAVSNWCRGKYVPRAIDPILDMLFDPEIQGPERANLRKAYNLAVEETVRQARLQPDFGSWVPKGPGLAFEPTLRPGDRKAARDPMQQQLQARIAEMARALAQESDRPSNTRLLPRLKTLAYNLTTVLSQDPATLPGRHLADAYSLLGRIAGILETDDSLQPDDNDAPLDKIIRGDTRDLLALGATWMRGYPSILAMDNRDAKPWPDAHLADAARTLLIGFHQHGCIGDDDLTDALRALDAATDLPPGPPKPNSKAWKAATFATARINNLIVTAARHAAAARVGIAPPNPDSTTRTTRLTRALIATAPQIQSLGAIMAIDLRYGLDALADQIARPTDAQNSEVAAISEPIPDDVEDKACELILNGQPPPASWRPFIKRLSFQTLDFADLTPIAGLTALETLYLSQTQVSDLTPIAGLTALETLLLSQTQVSDLTPIAGLTALENLDLSQTQVSDLTPIAGLTALENLDLSQTQVSDLTPIAGLTALGTLDLSQTQVSDLTPIAGLTALRILSFSQTQVSDLKPIAGLTALRILSFSQTQVSDLRPIAGLTALRELYLRDTQVTDLSSLDSLPDLEIFGATVARKRPARHVRAAVEPVMPRIGAPVRHPKRPS